MMQLCPNVLSLLHQMHQTCPAHQKQLCSRHSQELSRHQPPPHQQLVFSRNQQFSEQPARAQQLPKQPNQYSREASIMIESSATQKKQRPQSKKAHSAQSVK